MTGILLVSVGAVVGAIGRVSAEALLQRNGDNFPYGTLAVNVVGAFVLGVIAGAVRADTVSDDLLVLVGAGLAGSLTTFSGFAYRVEHELRARRWGLATAYVGTTFVLGLAAAAAGFALTG